VEATAKRAASNITNVFLLKGFPPSVIACATSEVKIVQNGPGALYSAYKLREDDRRGSQTGRIPGLSRGISISQVSLPCSYGHLKGWGFS
jgi:hypothetical protein